MRRGSSRRQTDIRSLLITGAMSRLTVLARKSINEGSWLAQMLHRKPLMLVAIALANKMARAIWAMMTKNEDYRDPTLPTVADRIAQMVVKRHLEPLVEPTFHQDSCCMDTAEQWEPDDGRVSRPVLRERRGETPLRHSPCGVHQRSENAGCGERLIRTDMYLTRSSRRAATARPPDAC